MKKTLLNLFALIAILMCVNFSNLFGQNLTSGVLKMFIFEH